MKPGLAPGFFVGKFRLIPLSKSEKGSLVMTPRTTEMFTRAA